MRDEDRLAINENFAQLKIRIQENQGRAVANSLFLAEVVEKLAVVLSPEDRKHLLEKIPLLTAVALQAHEGDTLGFRESLEAAMGHFKRVLERGLGDGNV